MKARFLVTCATGSIGTGLCSYLAKKGHDLIITARDLSKLQILAAEITKEFPNRKVSIFSADLGRPETMGGLVELGKIYGIKGIVLMLPRPPLLPKNPVDQIEILTKAMKDCFIGPRFLIQELIPILDASDLKSVVLVSGASSKQPISNPEFEAFNDIRTLWLGCLKTFADTYGPNGIRFNTVSPGQIETPTYIQIIQQEAQATGKLPTEVLREKTALVPLRKLASIKNVVNTIYFLLKSSGSNNITASNICVDGGAVRSYF